MKDYSQFIKALDFGKHLVVQGLPGAGKTGLLVASVGEQERIATVAAERGLAAEPIIAVPDKQAVRFVKTPLVEKYGTHGVTVRTYIGFAREIVRQYNLQAGRVAPRLLNGPEQDQLIKNAVELVEVHGIPVAAMKTAEFRTQMRDFWAMIDAFWLTPADFLKVLDEYQENTQSKDGRGAGIVTPEMIQVWRDSAEIIAATLKLMEAEHERYTAEGLLHHAAKLVATGEIKNKSVPGFILLDEAQNITEGALGLAAACATRGSVVWAFGTAETRTAGFRGGAVRILGSIEQVLREKTQFIENSENIRAEQNALFLDDVRYKPTDILKAQAKIATAIGSSNLAHYLSASETGVPASDAVVSGQVKNSSEQMGALGYRLKAANLGLGRDRKYAWREMAVVARTRETVENIAQSLAAEGIPTRIPGGGVILGKQRVVLELVQILFAVLEHKNLTIKQAVQLLKGPLFAIDTLLISRFCRAHRRVLDSDADLGSVVTEMSEEESEYKEVLEGLEKLNFALNEGMESSESGDAELEEILWAVWEKLDVADCLQSDVLNISLDDAERNAKSDTLDAVMSFFAAVRRENETNRVSQQQLLREIIDSDLPQDTLAFGGARDSVTVTTVQALGGTQYPVVCLADMQENAWPNLRLRGTLLGLRELEQVLRGGEVMPQSRAEVLREETNLLMYAVSRATKELFSVSIDNDTDIPSVFCRLLTDAEPSGDIPKTGLTLRGLTAQYRACLENDSSDEEKLNNLLVLAQNNVSGAHPNEWYGGKTLSGDPALFNKNELINISPSKLDKFDTSEIDWALSLLSGYQPSATHTQTGTLVHKIFEAAEGKDLDTLYQELEGLWGSLKFNGETESGHARAAALMQVEGVSEYVQKSVNDGWETVATEYPISFKIKKNGQDVARVSGSIDMVQRKEHNGECSYRIIDLKTGKTMSSYAQAEGSKQLALYQLGLYKNLQEKDEVFALAGAELVYVNGSLRPKGKKHALRGQRPLSAESVQELELELIEKTDRMRQASFNEEKAQGGGSGQNESEFRTNLTDSVSFTDIHIERSQEADNE